MSARMIVQLLLCVTLGVLVTWIFQGLALIADPTACKIASLATCLVLGWYSGPMTDAVLRRAGDK